MRYAFQIKLLAVLLVPVRGSAETAQQALARATAAVEAAAPRAASDPTRPIFHVTPPAQWMNDPNGPIFHRGYYHLFYQLHPFSDESGPKYWGHVRSRDLVKWERLPIALAPSGDRGEQEIWSGCCTLDGRGQPTIFYTSIAQGKSPFDHAEQWAATSDDDLIHWQKSSANPVLSETLHGGKKIYDWRDPFAFHEGKRTFLVAGGHLAKAGQAAVNIYEAEDPDLTRWKYQGVLFEVPDAPTAECPNFFRLADQWVLFVSPYGKVEYFVGAFDAQTCRFTPHTRGWLDYGPNFYAPNTMLVADGRRLVWGWVNGFPSGRGWNGCLSLPRQLSISHEGQLLQAPASQLKKLRGQPAVWRNIQCGEEEKTFSLPATNTLEILAELNLQQTRGLELKLTGRPGTAGPILINVDAVQLKVMEVSAPLQLARDAKSLELRIFVDGSVLEVVANETVWVTKTIAPPANLSLSLRSPGGPGKLTKVQAWPMKTIW